MTGAPDKAAALPKELSELARGVLGSYGVRWAPDQASAGPQGTESLGRLVISGAQGPQFLRLNTGDYPAVSRRSEGMPVAFVSRLEVAAAFVRAAPGHYSWFVQPQWCYLGRGGEVLLERRFKVDVGLPRDPRPWLPPERPLYPFASSVHKLVEKLAFFLDTGERGHNQMVVRVGRRIGEQLAGEFGAKGVPEPSDRIHTFWRGETLMLHDGELYGRRSDECWVWLGAEAKGALPAIMHFASQAGAAVEIAVPSFERTEAREPSEAPPLARLTKSGESVGVSCPYGTEHEAQSGKVFLEETSEGPVVHQVRVDDGRVATWERFGARGSELSDHCLAVDHFRGALSPRCLEWVRRYNAMYYPWLRADDAELHAAFARNGVELTGAHLELERMMGGLVVRGRDGADLESFGLGLHAESLRQVVISMRTSYSLDAYLTMGPDGTLTGGDMNEGSCPLARSWRQLLERRAIGYDGLHRQSECIGDLGLGRGRCSVLLTEPAGPELSRQLDIPESPLLSDDLTFFAEEAESLIWCPFSAAENDLLLDFYATELVTTNLDRAVGALRAAARCSGTVASFLDGPVDRKEEYQRPIVPPAELLAGAESFSLSDGHCSHGTAHVLGGPGNYRIEVVYDGPSHQVWRTFTPECNTLRSYYHG